MTAVKLSEIAAKHGFEVKQQPKGSGHFLFGGEKLAAAVRKLVR